MSETSKHMKSEHDIDDYKPYVCKHCKSAWGDVANYCRHVRSHYQQNVICNVCGAELKPGSLQHHINRCDQNLAFQTLVALNLAVINELRLMPCPFTGPKMFCAVPNFLCQTKNHLMYLH
jgi:hypothetical protein